MYDWIDPEWCRSFMLTRRVPGKTFEEAWPLLTTEHRLQIADQIAVHMKAISAFTSDHVETVTGKGIEGIHSLRLRVDLPFSVPRVEPPVSKEDYRKYLEKKYKQTDIPEIGEHFVLQHPDLNPTNYFVAVPSNPDEAAKLTAIIDWNRVGYYPAFNLTLYQRALSIYAVGGSREGADWMWMLSNALYKVGFPLEMEFLRRIWPVWGIQEKNLPEGIPKSTRGTMPQA